MAGTHTHVPTPDEQILPKGTAYLTDLCMTGPRDSVIGTDADAVLKRFLTGMPVKFEIPEGDVSLEGALIHLDPKTGRARSIRRVREKLKP